MSLGLMVSVCACGEGVMVGMLKKILISLLKHLSKLKQTKYM